MNTCSICRHPDRRGIDKALIAGDSLRNIAKQFSVGFSAVGRHRGCIAQAYESIAMQEKTYTLNLSNELASCVQRMQKVSTACEEALIDRRTGSYCLRKQGAVGVAALLLKTSDRLYKHLRMLAVLTGVFRQPHTNPRDVTRTLYNEWVGMFVAVLQNLDPRIERSAVVQLLSEMPETTGNFMPMVEEELGRVM